MAALTTDRNTQPYSLGDLLAIPVAAATRIFTGALVCSNAAGYAVPADDAAGYKFEGVAERQVDNRLGGDGAMSVLVRRLGRYCYAMDTDIDQSAMGACVYAVDDQTVEANAALTANDVLVGVIARVVSARVADIEIDVFTCRGAWSLPTTTTPAPAGTTTTAAPAPTTTTPGA